VFQRFRGRRWNWGFWLGVLVFLYFLRFPISSDLAEPARRMFAVTLLMALFWMSEAIPLAITALLPLVLFPVLEIMPTSQVAPNYAHHLIFLFMGGFFIANAIQKWNLHRRFALNTIRWLGNRPRSLLLGFMLATAFLSMWISNTATAVMIMPIGLAVVHRLEEENRKLATAFGTVLMLGIAYAASIGGTGTLIGTPPNLVFSAVYKKFFPDLPEITFAQWMLLIFPLTLILFGVTYFYLSRMVLGGGKDFAKLRLDVRTILTELQQLGPLNRPQKRVLFIFGTTALMWMFRSDIVIGQFKIPGWPGWIGLHGQIQDSTIAIGMAMLLFLIPTGEKIIEAPTLLHWKDILTIPWDILLLFGGGLALAEGIQSTGLAEFIARKLTFISALPDFVFIFGLTISVALLTEITSNTAVATTILPILAAVSQDVAMPPLILMLPATIAASCAFMLPVATPPNAIIFGTRLVPIRRMVQIGSILIVLSALINGVYFTLLKGILGN